MKSVADKDKEEIRLAVEAKEQYRLQLMSKPSVIGLGIGLRTRKGEVLDELCVKVYVSTKIPKDLLSKGELLPESLDFGNKKVPIDVEESEVPEAQLFTARNRPLVGGSSIGPTMVGFRSTGTLGACLTLDDGQTYILGNNHVLAAVDRLPIGSTIAQPSVLDGGTIPDDVVAELTAAVPIDFGTTTITILGITITIPNRNYVDCALARVQGAFNNANRQIHWIGYPDFSTVVGNPDSGWIPEALPTSLYYIPWLNRLVHKMGRTSEYTVGRVVDIAYDTFVDYSRFFGNPRGINRAWFVNQLRIRGIYSNRAVTMPGDSGSL